MSCSIHGLAATRLPIRCDSPAGVLLAAGGIHPAADGAGERRQHGERRCEAKTAAVALLVDLGAGGERGRIQRRLPRQRRNSACHVRHGAWADSDAGGHGGNGDAECGRAPDAVVGPRRRGRARSTGGVLLASFHLFGGRTIGLPAPAPAGIPARALGAGRSHSPAGHDVSSLRAELPGDQPDAGLRAGGGSFNRAVAAQRAPARRRAGRRGVRLRLPDSSHHAGRHWRRDGLPVPRSALDPGPDRRCTSAVARFRP